DHEAGHAPRQSLVAEVVEESRTGGETVEVRGQRQVQDLPGSSAGSGLRLHETLDARSAPFLAHEDVVRGRGQRKHRGEGVVEEEPQAPRGELAEGRRSAGRLAVLLAEERLDGAQVLELRRTDLQAHDPFARRPRKYWCQRPPGVSPG